MSNSRPCARRKAPPAEDAELSRLCDRFEALEKEANAAWATKPQEEAEQIAKATIAGQNELAAQICSRPARTPAGVVRKLRTIAVCSPHLAEARDNGNPDDLLIASALLDALGAPAPRPPVDLFRTAHARWFLALRLAAEALEARRKAEGQLAEAEAKLRRAAELGVWS